MMININKYNNQLGNIKNGIKNYEMMIYDNISVAKNLSFYWNDGYTKSFFKKIDSLLNDTTEFINFLYKTLAAMATLSSYYNSVNQNRHNLFGYSTAVINSSDFVEIAGDDEDVAEKKRIIRSSIMNAEDNITSVLSRLEVPFIAKISFENLDQEALEDNSFVGMLDNMELEIKKLAQKKQDIVAAGEALKNNFRATINLYNSNNSKKISHIIDEIGDSMYTLEFNLNAAYDYIIERRNSYNKLFSDMASSTSSINTE